MSIGFSIVSIGLCAYNYAVSTVPADLHTNTSYLGPGPALPRTTYKYCINLCINLPVL